MTMRYNYRRVKIHHSYSIPEFAKLLDVHKNTVSRWIAAGLQTIDKKRPLLIQGMAGRAFLQARQPPKSKCGPNEFWCFKCRDRRKPAFDEADYRPVTQTSGRLQALCPVCSRIMNRGVRKAEISRVCPDVLVTEKVDEQSIDDSSEPTLNVAIKKEN